MVKRFQDMPVLPDLKENSPFKEGLPDFLTLLVGCSLVFSENAVRNLASVERRSKRVSNSGMKENENIVSALDKTSHRKCNKFSWRCELHSEKELAGWVEKWFCDFPKLAGLPPGFVFCSKAYGQPLVLVDEQTNLLRQCPSELAVRLFDLKWGWRSHLLVALTAVGEKHCRR